MHDVIIIGAGPAGLFAADELSKRGKKVLVLEKGGLISERTCPLTYEKVNAKCAYCPTCNILSGVGGAGLFSDGKLNFIAKHGKTDLHQFVDEKEAESLLQQVDDRLMEFGIPEESYPKDMEKVEHLKAEAKKIGIDFLVIRQKHIGSDKLPEIIGNMVKKLEEQGVIFALHEEAYQVKVENGEVKGVVTNKGTPEAPVVLCCPGRVGSEWFMNECRRLNIPLMHRGIEVGVRVEVPHQVMEQITDIVWDPTFFINTKAHDDMVRTFCTNPNGFVTTEKYDGFACVNGYSRHDKKSENTNFALLSDINLTHPVSDTINYGKSIGQLSYTIGGKKPILQRFVDLKKGRRSYWDRIHKSMIKPTMTDVTPGDLSMAFPGRIADNLIESLEKLDKLIPGIANDSTLLYGPEIKFFSVRVKTEKNLATQVKGLFVAGDGVGVCGNIVGAAATGIIAARGILNS
ncbi:MAG: FAD-dependent oxidoreductase [Nanoarchaeota archaeon]|nr:FAD-dependent oxidoreductase [Nanoarchaeota archaeon]